MALPEYFTSSAEEEIRREAETRLERKKSLIETGTKLIQEGQLAKGRAFLKRVAEEFSDDEGHSGSGRQNIRSQQLPGGSR